MGNQVLESTAGRLDTNAADREVLRRWQEYGQKGATPNRRILPSDWPGIQPFRVPRSIKWSKPIAAHQLPLLVKGFLPSESDSAALANLMSQGLFQVGDTLTTHGFMSTSNIQHKHISEDKWFVYADGPDAHGNIALHMHRSWTGKKVLQLTIQAEDFCTSDGGSGLAEITHLTWETEPSVSEEEDEEHAKKTAIGVCDWVLDVDLDELEYKVKPTPEELAEALSRVMSGLPTTGAQTLTRNGQNPGRGASAYT